MSIQIWVRVDTPLARRRRAMGITQQELARRCGVYVVTISRYERGSRIPRGEQLKCLIRETGLSYEQILFPDEYLRNHPTFLMDFAESAQKRGRPPRQS